jgi:hypothetical protein
MMASSWGDATNADLNGFVLTIPFHLYFLITCYTMQAMNYESQCQCQVKFVKDIRLI